MLVSSQDTENGREYNGHFTIEIKSGMPHNWLPPLVHLADDKLYIANGCIVLLHTGEPQLYTQRNRKAPFPFGHFIKPFIICIRDGDGGQIWPLE